jgi:hypothetical protein
MSRLPLETAALEAVFDYLAGEVLEQLPEASRDLLMALAFLPHFSAATAIELSERPDAERLLAELEREHRLLQRHSDGLYRLHDLLRAFLLERGRIVHSPSRRRKLQAHAAQLLGDQGDFDAAIALLAETQDWPALIGLIERSAAGLAAQGRVTTIARAADLVPEAAAVGHPWLRFWRAVAGLGRESSSSRSDAEQAFQEFGASGNVIGSYMAWSVVLRAIVLQGDDFRHVTQWLKTLQTLPPMPPVPGITARVALTELMGWAHACIFDGDVYARAERALDLVTQYGSADERIFAISAIATLYAFGGEGARARTLVGSSRQQLTAASKDPLAQLAHLCSELMVGCLTSTDFRSNLAHADSAWAYARTEGVASHDASISFAGALSALALSDTLKTREYLEQMRSSPNVSSRRGRAGYAFMSAWEALENSEFDACDDWLERCRRDTDALGFPFASYTVSYGELICAAARGEPERIRAALAVAEPQLMAAQSPRQSAAGALTIVYARLCLGECSNAELAAAFAGARRFEFTCDYFFGRRVLRQLCTAALERSIDVDYAARMLRAYEIPPDDSSLFLEHWPWPVRISLLGRLELSIDGRAVEFGRKLPTVPLALLKLLALAGEPVPVEKALSALWPGRGSSPDRGSLDTAVYRLRKLLGRDDVVVHHNGLLALARERCWTDVGTVRLICDRVDDGAHDLPAQASRYQRMLATLCHGPLATEGDAKALRLADERLQGRIQLARARLSALR